MIYSIWNQSLKRYDYYQSPGAQDTANTPKPGHLRSPKLGLTVDQAAWPVPTGAVKVGHGAFPRGRIASVRRGFGAFDTDRPMVLLGLFGLSAFLLYKYVR